MKRILIPLVIALALGSVVSFGQVASKLPSKVPKGKTYVYYDSKGKELRRRKSGQSARSNNITDCAQIPCPSTFGPDIICWKCVERPSTVKQ
jgi:hypothetical protein